MNLENKFKGERCPGEQVCIDTREMPLNRYLPQGKSIDEICNGCHLNPTKPGSEAPHLTHWIGAALALRSIHEMGATFAYPDALLPREWIALRALADADAIVQTKKARAKEKAADNARRGALPPPTAPTEAR